jgi:predicted nucleic acid-binding protein
MKLKLAMSDTGPLLYLSLIGELRILTDLFDRVLLLTTVRDELIHPKAPRSVQELFRTPPAWLELSSINSTRSSDEIGLAEAHAIDLAQRTRADVLLIDEAAGRLAAKVAGLNIMGTIGTLEQAASRGLLDLAASFVRLQQTNFFGSPKLFEAALKRHAERRK